MRPDMFLCNGKWEKLSLSNGSPISMIELVAPIELVSRGYPTEEKQPKGVDAL
jgi:hypothetical protein